MLQLVNSAFFALAREVSDMLDAAMILGTERIKSLILLAGVFSQYDKSQGVGSSIDALLAHSINVGVYARAIALKETKSAEAAEAAFTAGILHDVGKVILAVNLPDQYQKMLTLRASGKIPDLAAELEVFGTTHARIGACLMASWGLPLPILEAVAWHHEPELSSDAAFTLLAAVHAANAFSHGPAEMPARLHEAYYVRIGMAGQCALWSKMFGLDKPVSD
jgi:putative nucleotidyltransferase with HDIG domain